MARKAKRSNWSPEWIIYIVGVLALLFYLYPAELPLSEYQQPEPIQGTLEEPTETTTVKTEEIIEPEPGPECTSNSQCGSFEYCSNNNCVQLNCAAGEEIVNHQCQQVTGLHSKAQSYITPFNSAVLSKLESLTKGDYSEESFEENLDAVYYYTLSTTYKYDEDKWGVGDYWQTPEVTIADGTGDCEDHALLLQSLIEALLFKTYGEIPAETAYVLCGCIDFDYDGEQDGCHCWNIIEASKLPSNAFTFSLFDTKAETSPSSRQVILNDVTVDNVGPNPFQTSYNPALDKRKSQGQPLVVFWEGRKWIELETTWNMPLSYYEGRTYPFVSVWNAFNSQEYYDQPDFVKGGRRATIFEDMYAYLTGWLKGLLSILTE